METSFALQKSFVVMDMDKIYRDGL